MEWYAPSIKDLAPRDMVSRAILTEIQEGRGINGDGYVYLDLTHLEEGVVEEKLSEITEISRNFLDIDPVKEPIPVAPTCHYMMGGVPTDVNGAVPGVEGLYSVGESACVSVHGSNRLGCNSLIDLVVFGKRAGRNVSDYVSSVDWSSEPDSSGESVISTLLNSDGGETIHELRGEMRRIMTSNVSIFRAEESLTDALSKIRQLRLRQKDIGLSHRGKVHNMEVREALELGNMLRVAEAVIVSALNREESRGAHSRTDYPDRDDENWLKHTLIQDINGVLEITYKPVTITRFQPKERRY